MNSTVRSPSFCGILGRGFVLVWGAVNFLSLGVAQVSDPAVREDMEIERQKILRAADQIEFIVDQQNKLIREIDGLKKTVESVSRENARLKEENGQLAKRLDQAEAQRGKEREALLNEVSKLVAESKKSAPQAAPKEPVRAPVKAEEGFEHVVARGDTLWAITEAYRAAGVKVTMEEIRAANGLKEGQALRVGQKLFIPKK